MSQHDMNFTNSNGAAVRADMNNAMIALVTNNSGSSEPLDTFGNMWWADETNHVMKQRNEADTAWHIKFSLDADLVLAKTAAYTVGIRDVGKLVGCDATSGAFTVTLPAAASAGEGFRVSIKKTDSSANAITIDGDGTETIDGSTTVTIDLENQVLSLICDGSNWLIASDAIAASQAEMEAGTETALRSMSPERVKQAIDALAPPTNKNLIINGDMRISQRGVSFTGVSNGDYTLDRYRYGQVGAGVVDVLQTADAPTVAEAGVYTDKCLHIDVTTADASIAASDLYVVEQRIEGNNLLQLGFGQSGTRYVTLSFWHKHTKTGTYCVALVNSAATRSYIAEYTQSVSDTWEKATITIPVDTAGTWLTDTGIGVRAIFSLAMGSDYHATADTWNATTDYATSNQVNALDSVSNNFKTTLIQLEAGQVATDFESRQYGEELALCQRYYEESKQRVYATAVYDTGSSTVRNVFQDFLVEKRANPAMVTTDVGWSGSPTITARTSGFELNGNAATSGTAASVTDWTADAEL